MKSIQLAVIIDENSTVAVCMGPSVPKFMGPSVPRCMGPSVPSFFGIGRFHYHYVLLIKGPCVSRIIFKGQVLTPFALHLDE